MTSAPATHNGKRIRTEYVRPPVPTRKMDWCAYFDGEEESSWVGHGSTEAEAVADFISNLDEE